MDNTIFAEMINPHTKAIVVVPCSPRHNGGMSVELYKGKGFILKVDYDASEKINQKLKRLDELEGKRK